MKKTGITKTVDNLGRIVLPARMLERLDIEKLDKVELCIEEDSIVVRKYVPEKTCVFCGSAEGSAALGDKFICPACVAQIKQME
jgi:transcriptional pleiotropic regulator of transition state genes